MITKLQAIISLVPSAQVVINNDVVEWIDPVDAPITEDQIQQEIDRLTKQQPFEDCKAKAKQLIVKTDWAVLPDVGLQNKADFEAYRATLRALILNPVADPVFPTEPQPVWS